ncbi:peptide ABC transporter permease [Brevibacterium sp. HMSC08F02]|uniref:ABC transporter permease n=2 Tax=Brevibacterium TaxID=1696 RepID=A0A150H5S0_9MICO|nr:MULTISPECIES: ABC transporter permease [Brevibacterium]KXZ57198.1 Dipeptide transport system permease protein DppB [Brevibacterium ravenspurgense]MCG7300749.1 ABC transporter permease [Brevibacterium ravenspurgense]OFT25894.1 peptide ABC transporter permease [Brevibacterium sp. HMSC08F02]OFT95996.1 peptide ABC transporter permease [Brevibacterium sp. HMSC22B09]PKY70725.1 ABC transporter permease [Brevibacterium ravenspurgense]
MIAYILRRVVNYVILTALATTCAYMLTSSFMDPAKRYRGKNPPLPESTITAKLDELGVNPDTPLITRTWNWATNILFHADFGLTVGGQPVLTEMLGRSVVSLRLLIVGSILGALLGVAIGVWGAVRQYKASDNIITALTYVINATPTFVLGIILMILATGFNNAVGTQLIRFVGPATPGVHGFWPQVADTISHMLLPTIALVVFGAAIYSRYQRSMMLDVLGADYIRTARSKGLTRKTALWKHGVRVAIIPMSTYFAYSFGTMLAGSTFLEIIFSWNGMGQMALDSITGSDINAAAGTTFFAAVLVLISSTLSEVLYAALDPRVRS